METIAAIAGFDEGRLLGRNLRRLMAQYQMRQADVVAATGLDERTVRSVVNGRGKAHAKTIGKLAHGLGVQPAELLRDSSAAARIFDRDTNRVLRDYLEQHPRLFREWTDAEIDELASRFGVGGELTAEGVATAVAAIEARRELVGQVAVILETDFGQSLREIVGGIFKAATKVA